MQDALFESTDMLLHLLPFGVLAVDLDDCLTFVNPALETMFGYSAGRLHGQPLATLFPDDLEDFHKARTDSSPRSFQAIRGCHQRGHAVWVDVQVQHHQVDGQPMVLGWVTDVTQASQRKQTSSPLQQQASHTRNATLTRLLQDVVVAANQATTIEAALQTVLDLICACIKWPIGHAFIRDDAVPDRLISTAIWHLDNAEHFATFRSMTEALHFSTHDSLPGVVLATGQPVWIADMTTYLMSKRFKLIQQVGLHTGFAFPVLVGNDVAAVLEFFSDEHHEQNAMLLDIIANVGTQIGRVVERVRAETALRASEERYRLIAENTADLIMLVNQDGRVHYASPSFRRVLGYDPNAIIHNSVLNIVHHEDQSHAQATWHRIIADGFGEATVRCRTANGTWRWVEIVGTAATQPNVPYVVLVGHDVTNRRHVEEAIRIAEARYRTLIEQLPAITYTATLDEQSSTTYVSPQITQILGFTPDEWVADPALWIQQLHPDDREQVSAFVKATQQSQHSVICEYRSFTRDGRIVWLEDTSKTIRDEDGKPLFMQGIVRDVTERKQAEESIRRSEQLYRALARNVPNGAVFLIDHDLRYIVADGEVLRRRMAFPETFEGRTLDEVVPADIREEYRAYYRAALAGTPTTMEATLYNRDYVIYYLPVRNEQGHIFAALGMFHDITDLKRAERELRDERELLARRIEERTADISAVNAELARVARHKDEFLANMSHELRTPLNAVLGFSETLREQVYGPLNTRQDHFLQLIEESGRDLLALINDILDLAKTDAGKMDLVIEPTPVDQLCHASMRLVQQLASKKQVAVQLQIDPHAGQVLADPRRLKQVLVNLLVNAIKFTPVGGTSGLEVATDNERGVLHFTVWDTGIGIAPDHIATIFQPFVQLDSQLTREYDGTGLGLALVYRMIELHGGSVSVVSDVGIGSRFTVTLPWYREAATMPRNTQRGSGLDVTDSIAVQRSTNSIPATLQQLEVTTILLAEDNELNITTVIDYLSGIGYHMVVARDGEEAVALAEAIRPQLILMDIQMPKMDGLEAIRCIRADPQLANIPIIALTALAMVSDRERCLAAGATAYLSKPVRLKELAATIAQFLQGQLSETRARAE